MNAQNAAGGNEYVAPQAKQLVGRHGGPIHPRMAQVVALLGLDPERQCVFLAWSRHFGDVEGETAHGPRRLVGVGNLLPIEPDVGTVADTLEV
jgi:hypothetical protein